jgi:hypothetical protein
MLCSSTYSESEKNEAEDHSKIADEGKNPHDGLRSQVEAGEGLAMSLLLKVVGVNDDVAFNQKRGMRLIAFARVTVTKYGSANQTLVRQWTPSRNGRNEFRIFQKQYSTDFGTFSTRVDP